MRMSLAGSPRHQKCGGWVDVWPADIADTPTLGLSGVMGQGVPAEEHQAGFILKGFSSLIL